MMPLGPADFDLFWQAAARPIPVMIVGGGRWGRVWAQVLSASRGDANGIAIVARRNHAETREWAHSAGFGTISVVDSIAAALAIQARPELAIVASRPRDHARDTLEALAAGLHVLVEKPIAGSASDAASMVAAAAKAGRLFGVGTEFALLPAFHQMASIMKTRDADEFSATLEWTDPRGEVRHGLRKTMHDEVTILDDLLPHALSVFRTLRPQARFTLSDRWLQPQGRRGGFELRDQHGWIYVLSCDAESESRRRFLRLEANGDCGTVDFSNHPPKLVLAGETVELTPDTVGMTSTLRLEFGAFAAELTGLISSTPLTSGLDEMIALHAAIESFPG